MLVKNQFYRRNLPHFHPEGYPLFITFRLANSLPGKVLSRLKQERELEKLATNSSVEHYATAKYPVADTLRLLKGSTARYCNEVLKRNGAFWQHESYDHYVRDEDELERVVIYILNNPVKAGLVDAWKDWSFSYVNPELGEW